MVVPGEGVVGLVECVEVIVEFLEGGPLGILFLLVEVIKVQVGEVVEEEFLQLGLILRVTVHQRPDPGRILGLRIGTQEHGGSVLRIIQIVRGIYTSAEWHVCLA